MGASIAQLLKPYLERTISLSAVYIIPAKQTTTQCILPSRIYAKVCNARKRAVLEEIVKGPTRLAAGFLKAYKNTSYFI
jgi:hypothetical protein